MSIIYRGSGIIKRVTNQEHQNAAYESATADVFEIPALPEWFREPGTEASYRPWQHTPLDPYSSDVRGHQIELGDAFYQLAVTPPPELQDTGLEQLVSLDFLAGMTLRETRCKENYNDWVQNHPEELVALRSDSVMEWLIGEGLAGHGSARGQLEILRRAPSLKSLDLQVLTTPFGYRSQYLPEMRSELYEALQAVGATVYSEPQWLDKKPPKIAVDPTCPVNSELYPRGLLVTFKRKIAELDDVSHEDASIAVIVREAWLVPTHIGSGFPRDILDTMRREPSWESLDQMKPFAAQVQELVVHMITHNEGVIPLSVATFATR